MRSTAQEVVRRATPLVYYLARQGQDERRDATTRALLMALGEDVVARVDEVIAALCPEDAGDIVARDLDCARRRLRTARELGEVRNAG
jgi:hypothetical protein